MQAQPRVVEPEPHERQQEVHLNMIKKIVALKKCCNYLPYFFCWSIVLLYKYLSFLLKKNF